MAFNDISVCLCSSLAVPLSVSVPECVLSVWRPLAIDINS